MTNAQTVENIFRSIEGGRIQTSVENFTTWATEQEGADTPDHLQKTMEKMIRDKLSLRLLISTFNDEDDGFITFSPIDEDVKIELSQFQVSELARQALVAKTRFYDK